MNAITINGTTYQGNSVSIIGGNVIIDGKPAGNPVSGVVEIRVEGNLCSLDTDASVVVNGNVNGNVSARGAVNCKSVGVDVHAGGSVVCGSVGGNIQADGSVVHQ